MAQTKNSKTVWIARVVLALVLIAALCVSLLWTKEINRRLGLTQTVDGQYDGNSVQEVLESGEIGENLNVHFVDVGQGDACIIELPDDKTMLIDAGENKTAHKTALLSYIKDNINDDEGNDIAYFDYVILTHPDSDHCGGMYDVLNAYPAKTFYRPAVYSSYTGNGFTDPDTTIDRTNKNNVKDTATYGRAIQAGYEAYGNKFEGEQSVVYISDAKNEEISRITPEGLQEGDADYYSFTFYAPLGSSYGDWNDYSPVMILEYHNKRFMLSGDAEKEAEAQFVSAATAGEGKYSIFTDTFTVDVFKLGHHGSRTSSSEAFIDIMTTEENCPNVIAVISCGENNKYKHPHTQVLDRLKAKGFADENIVRTDRNGDIAMSVKGVRDESTGQVTYELMMGAETVRRTAAKVGNDTVHLTWTEIVLLGCIVVVAVLIVIPAVTAARKRVEKEVRAARRTNKGGRR